MSAVVVDRAVVAVAVDGVPLAPGVASGLQSLRVRQVLSLPSVCELEFGEPAVGAAGAFSIGAAVHVTLPSHGEALFAGDVTAVEWVYDTDGTRRVLVRAYDPLHRLRKRQTVVARAQADAVALARELAAEIGLDVESAAGAPVIDRLFTHQTSDLDQLRAVCRAAGLAPIVRGTTLHLVTAAGIDEPLPLRLGHELLEARVSRNADASVGRTEVVGWRPADGTVVRGEASAPNGPVTAVQAEVFDVDPARQVLGVAVEDAPEAAARAQAEVDARAAHNVAVAATVVGDPRLRPGQPICVTGRGSGGDTIAVVAIATHTVDADRGYLTVLDTRPPTTAAPPGEPAPALVPGVVSRIDDPERRGRVKVTFPTHADLESGWLQVLTAAAAAGRGIVALPDVDDRVLVALVGGDPRHGIVLGSLYGEAAPHDDGVGDGRRVRHSWRTGGGQNITLDDSGSAVRIENDRGSFLELLPDLVRLRAGCDLEIEAPGKRIVLRADAIDLERA